MSLQEKANDAYYNEDEKILTDKEFDLLSDNGLEIKNFRNKAKHFQPMGSLKKIKTEDDFLKWRQGREIRVTPKLDGNSVEIIVVDGKFEKAITRGNGKVGNDITDKAVYCNLKHILLDGAAQYSIKCEAIMKKEYQKDYNKNIRNVVAGILNRKTPQIEELKKIDIIPFNELDFIQSKNISYLEMTDGFEAKKEIYPYEIDGLVVELIDPIYEEKDELLPANIVALKFNKEGIDAEVGNIEWNLGKHAKLTPVIVLKDAVEIDGTNVQRVTASNWSLLVEAGLGVGAKVQVIKSGDIIPYISQVVKKSNLINNPYCPSCGFKGVLNESKVQMICPNNHCLGEELVKLQHIFGTFDLDYISDATVERLYVAGFKTIEDIFNLSLNDLISLDGFGPKKSSNIIYKLNTVALTEAKVLKCAMVPGISESNAEKLINHFGNIENFLYPEIDFVIDYTSIDGFAEITSNTIKENMNKFQKIYEILKKHIIILKIEKTKLTPNGLNIVFTGKCETHNRKELTTFLKEKGYNVQKNINKETDILLVADINSTSSKMKKAGKLGIKIQTYDEYFKE